MFHRFRHEARYYPTLSRVPLDVRMKLDLTGAKISLNDWLSFSFEERTVLCHLPCASAEEKGVFTSYLSFLSSKYTGAPLATTDSLDGALWDGAHVPEEVRQKSAECGRAVDDDEWRNWDSHQRYALYKTAVSRSQPEAFSDVLEELRRRGEFGAAK
jgi:hypothetical protein